MTVIEDDLLSLIEATAWAVDPETITKSTYIFSQSHSKTLNLRRPLVAGTATVIVIDPSVRAPIDRSRGSATYQFNGDVRIHATSYDFLKKMMELLKIIVDAVDNLLFFFPGVDRDRNKIETDYFFNTTQFQWDIFEGDT